MPLISPLQILRSSIPPRPELVGFSTQTSTGTPITITLPRRENGILLIAIICKHAGGSNAPGTPTNWVSLTSNLAAPAYNLVYRICGGSDALTTTSSSISATSMSCICVAIRNWNRQVVPVSGTVSSVTTTTPNPGNCSFSGGLGRNVLWLPMCWWNGNATLSGWPANYTEMRKTVNQSTNGGSAMIGRHQAADAEDAGAFTITASLSTRAVTVGVAG